MRTKIELDLKKISDAEEVSKQSSGWFGGSLADNILGVIAKVRWRSHSICCSGCFCETPLGDWSETLSTWLCHKLRTISILVCYAWESGLLLVLIVLNHLVLLIICNNYCNTACIWSLLCSASTSILWISSQHAPPHTYKPVRSITSSAHCRRTPQAFISFDLWSRYWLTCTLQPVSADFRTIPPATGQASQRQSALEGLGG